MKLLHTYNNRKEKKRRLYNINGVVTAAGSFVLDKYNHHRWGCPPSAKAMFFG